MRLLLAVSLALLAALPAGAATVLLDFESETDLRVWHYERSAAGTPVRELSRVERYATSGRFSMCFRSPAWKTGMGEWPSFEGTPPVTDWSRCDRLAFDVTNVTGAQQQLFLFISDSKIATRGGLLHRQALPAYSCTRVAIALGKLAAHRVNPADVHVLHFFTERPPADMEVYIDRLVLLRPGEPLPALSPAFLAEFAPLQQRHVDAVRRLAAAAGARLRKMTAGAPSLAAWAGAALRAVDAKVNAYAGRVAQADPAAFEDQTPATLPVELGSLEALAKLRAGFAQVRPRVQAGKKPRPDLVVGFATSMEKVLPRALPSSLTVSERAEIRLAQNEKESLQVIVLPCERDVNVRVRVADLRGPKGARFPAANVDAVVMGYVQTRTEPPYGSSHVGWWPDPILNFQTTAGIARGDAQAFWIRFRAPKNQPAGLYHGKLEVEADGARVFSFDLAVRVYGFRLPDASPLPLAVTFWPMYYEPGDKEGSWREGELRDTSWMQHKREWGDFLADYYLTYDSLYAFAHWAPDFEVLQRLHKQGRLGRFNLGYYSICGESPAEVEKWRKSTVDVIRPRYEKARELGLLEFAYIYGCDENPESMFPGVQRAAEILKKEFPGVTILTTTYDHTFGTGSVIKAIDAFCPLTPRFDPKLAAQARASGKEVWWYICCGPGHPFANMFVEYPAIEGRLLMGAMTAKYRPDGFLYYQISIWNGKPITAGPFTEWDPRSWTTYHGDGSWTCLGPGGTPLPTIRLENFRDGLEDYAYARILEATIARAEASPDLRARRADWLAKAKVLLIVPDDVAKSLTEYTHDPAAVYRYRDGLAEAIEAAGL